jgi:hypothetical protein
VSIYADISPAMQSGNSEEQEEKERMGFLPSILSSHFLGPSKPGLPFCFGCLVLTLPFCLLLLRYSRIRHRECFLLFPSGSRAVRPSQNTFVILRSTLLASLPLLTLLPFRFLLPLDRELSPVSLSSMTLSDDSVTRLMASGSSPPTSRPSSPPSSLPVPSSEPSLRLSPRIDSDEYVPILFFSPLIRLS